MANYNTLKAYINQRITENHQNSITGPLLNQVLMQMVSSMGDGYQFKGVANPGTSFGTPDQRVFYLAVPGTYTSIGGIVIPANSIGILTYDSAWHGSSLSVGGGGGTEISYTFFDIDQGTDEWYSSITYQEILSREQSGEIVIGVYTDDDLNDIYLGIHAYRKSNEMVFTNYLSYNMGVTHEFILKSDNTVEHNTYGVPSGQSNFMGLATTTTNPGTPVAGMTYLAKDAGFYTHLGGWGVSDGQLVMFVYENNDWSKYTLVDKYIKGEADSGLTAITKIRVVSSYPATLDNNTLYILV